MIRNSKIEDIPQLINLWKKTGLYFQPFDASERLEEKIKKEPDLLLVAEADSKVVGAVIGNYGWRVSIDHLAVDSEYTGGVLGKQLFDKIKENLKARGATIALFDTSVISEKIVERYGGTYRGSYSNYSIEL